MTTKLDDMVRQTQRYFYDDGLVEAAVGLLFLAVGLVLFAWRNIGDSTSLTVFLALAIPALTLGGAWLLKRGVQAAKERITYPRTGYVAYRPGEPAVGRWLGLFAAVLVALAILFLPNQYNQTQLAVGALLAAILAYLGYTVGLWRFYLVAALALAVGLGSAGLLDDELIGTGLTFGLAGLALLLTGGLALARYLYRHPQADEEAS